MGKRSNFDRIPHDFYPTPAAAVAPLIPWLHASGIRDFAEPCAGAGDLVRHLESHGLHCVYQGDITDGRDALTANSYGPVDAIITNPPWTRSLLHPLIEHFQAIAPTWLLLDQDWACTKQAVPYLSSCSDILSIGRVIWIPGTSKHGFDNAAWYRFDHRHRTGPAFHPFRSAPAQHQRSDNRRRYHGPRGTSRRYVLARLARAGHADLAARVEAGELSVRAALRQLRGGGYT